MPKIIVYPGTFDPIHYGHLDLIKKIATEYDRVIVGVAKQTGEKTPSLAFEERVRLATAVVEDLGLPNVEVCSFSGLLVNFAEQKNATTVLRGVRNEQDARDETIVSRVLQSRIGSMNFFNPFMAPLQIITMEPSDSQFQNLSSTKIRNLIRANKDFSELVPTEVVKVYEGKSISEENKKNSGAIDWRYNTTYQILSCWDNLKEHVIPAGLSLLALILILSLLINNLEEKNIESYEAFCSGI